jgi:hypothetical protein
MLLSIIAYWYMPLLSAVNVTVAVVGVMRFTDTLAYGGGYPLIAELPVPRSKEIRSAWAEPIPTAKAKADAPTRIKFLIAF